MKNNLYFFRTKKELRFKCEIIIVKTKILQNSFGDEFYCDFCSYYRKNCFGVYEIINSNIDKNTKNKFRCSMCFEEIDKLTALKEW